MKEFGSKICKLRVDEEFDGDIEIGFSIAQLDALPYNKVYLNLKDINALLLLIRKAKLNYYKTMVVADKL